MFHLICEHITGHRTTNVHCGILFRGHVCMVWCSVYIYGVCEGVLSLKFKLFLYCFLQVTIRPFGVIGQVWLLFRMNKSP